MLGLNDIADKLGGFVSDADGVTSLPLGQIQNLLAQAGIDPTQLANLAPDQITELLARAGIDPASLGEGQIADLVQQVAGDQLPAAGGLFDFLGSFLKR
jgi:ABC-type nitrate/sulfonate/bicarbonate transport system substrate-binding protein